MRTLQVLGIPEDPIPGDIEAIVVALKTRTAPAGQAVAQSLDAVAWLQSLGARQFFFKYCSTFDSTEKGNIGHVTDALAEALAAGIVFACPAFPKNGRTVYNGHLFVGETLLNESGMENHPLTPMTDANLVRVLQRQTPNKVGLVPFSVVSQGSRAIARFASSLVSAGYRHAIVDALTEEHLLAIGASCADAKLITGGSGMALGLPENFRKAGLLQIGAPASALPAVNGPEAVLAGSCSLATNAQVAEWKKKYPGFRLCPLELAKGGQHLADALEWAKATLKNKPILIYATAEPETVSSAQRQLGAAGAGELVEAAMATIARELHGMGVRKLIVAGGETAGAVVKALNIRALRIGPMIDPGVPWTASVGGDPMALALKSGNFGTVDFFEKALQAI
jgi:uncharacterized protein YgbK (DUF1537 family)